MEKKRITEEMKVQDEWYKTAHKMTTAELPEFIRHLTEDYEHDYGTICHAVAAAALGAAYAVNDSPVGGITGFQAGAVMWEFISEWQQLRGHALRLIDFDELLYPQYAYKFRKITAETWKHIQDKATAEIEKGEFHVHPNVRAHWKSIAAGIVPFGLEVEAE